jgi:hypothetical protein
MACPSGKRVTSVVEPALLLFNGLTAECLLSLCMAPQTPARGSYPLVEQDTVQQLSATLPALHTFGTVSLIFSRELVAKAALLAFQTPTTEGLTFDLMDGQQDLKEALEQAGEARVDSWTG